MESRRRQAARNNRAIDTPWIVPPGPDAVFSKKQVWDHYRSFNRLGKESVYGTVFRISKKEAEKFLETMDRDSQTRYGRLSESLYALKIIHKKRDQNWRDFAIVVQREANIQKMVHTSFPEITPPVVFAGMNNNHGTGYIASPWVSGLKSLDKRYTASMYPAIDDMFSNVWSLGVLHMDAHLNNIFTKTPSQRVMLLDWGASAFVPVNLVDDLRRQLRQRSPETPLHEVWNAFVRNHPDEQIEQRLYNQVIFRAGAASLRKRNADWLVLRAMFAMTGTKPTAQKKATKSATKRQQDTSSQPTRRKRVFRKVVAKGSAPAFREFPYPDSAWSRILFENTPKKSPKKNNAPKTTSTKSSLVKKQTTFKQNKTKNKKNNNSTLSSVTVNPAIRMEQSTRG